jgi:hypothetical protein
LESQRPPTNGPSRTRCSRSSARSSGHRSTPALSRRTWRVFQPKMVPGWQTPGRSRWPMGGVFSPDRREIKSPRSDALLSLREFRVTPERSGTRQLSVFVGVSGTRRIVSAMPVVQALSVNAARPLSNCTGQGPVPECGGAARFGIWAVGSNAGWSNARRISLPSRSYADHRARSQSPGTFIVVRRRGRQRRLVPLALVAQLVGVACRC